MSNSTRQGGYDERLVVPLEASRRGAHRARMNPVLAALPLLAVIVVVAAVIGVAYTLFLRPNTQDANESGPTTPAATATPPAASAPAAAPAASQPSASAGSASASSSASAGASSAATIDKTVVFAVYNATQVKGLAAKAKTTLTADGFTAGQVLRGTPPVVVSRTTVFYAKASQAATAKAMAKTLNAVAREDSAAATPSRIVVVVSSDFTG
jgi:LytR cell envelope-related transcriptional attenuator